MTLNPAGSNNALLISTKPANLGTAGNFNGSVIRYFADPTVTGTSAQAQWDSTDKVLTVRINSGHTTANAILTAINGIAGSPWTASSGFRRFRKHRSRRGDHFGVYCHRRCERQQPGVAHDHARR